MSHSTLRNAVFRSAILGAIGAMLLAAGCRPATADLIKRAKAETVGKRLEAIHALQGFGGDKKLVIPALVEALDDGNSYVRRDAARALGHIGAAAKGAVPALLARSRDREPSVRKAAAWAVKEIDSAR